MDSLYEGDLSDPVGEPADDVDSDHGEDQLGHLPVALPLALRPLLSPRPHRPQLDDHYTEGCHKCSHTSGVRGN